MGPFEPNRLLSTREGAHFWRQRMKEEHTVERLPQSMHTELIQMDHKTSKLQLTSKNNHTPVYSRMSGGGGVLGVSDLPSANCGGTVEEEAEEV